VQNPEQDDNDDDDEMGTNDDAALEAASRSAAALEYAGCCGIIVWGLFGPLTKKPAAPSQPERQFGEAGPDKPTPKIDDDGFVQVKTKWLNRK
jgi:hypothetical protein